MQASRFGPARQSLLAARARHMRFNPTASESRLWRCIGARKLGVAFRRQFPVGRYVADFYAPEVGLAVEVDGKYHARRAQADARRDAALRRLGCRVLRLEAELVMRDLPAAVARIAAALELLSAAQ
jgi:very-short-patch-repair endonuclease